MQILSFPEADTPAALRAQVLDLQRQAWPPAEPSPGPHPTLTHDPALHPRSMLLVDDDGTVVAALDVLSKPLVHAGRRYRAGGLSTVVTRSAVRGRGYGRRLVAAARTAMADAGLDLGVFTCDRPLEPFYRSAGWRLLPGTHLIGGTPQCPLSSDRPPFDKVTMAAFFSAEARRHHVAFRHTRLALYPGTIDRLW
ncbi:N-acetyltransferase [Streptomyces nigrescens]|uniref:N-acetyltransferase n=1 Tax=Streptomyces nigrescens TaxID=1920 RepID=A0ABM7ZT55_STRNI|nr:GNAT family N-acetyltransferase [Streptomyces nigrescens]BDM69493.1 N-acetyltransferase [Streptomyces nigrescens]